MEQKDDRDVSGGVLEIAAALFEGLKGGWGRIMRELATDAGISVDDTSPKGVWFRIECLIFEWFVTDFVIAHHVEKGADAIRDVLMHFVYEALRDALRVEGMPQEVLREIDRRRMERFDEYYRELVGQLRDNKGWGGPPRLGLLAAERIVGSRDLGASVVLGMEAWATYVAFGKALRKIKVVGN